MGDMQSAAERMRAALERLQQEKLAAEDGPYILETPLPPPTRKNLFSHADAHPYVLDLAVLQKYGPEWLEWEPETLELSVAADWGHRISPLNLEKLQAVKALHLVDTFWHEWEVFLAITMPLNGFMPDFKAMQVPTVAQCAVAVDIAKQIRGELDWSDEMKAYLETVHLHDGVFCAIEPLSFANVDSTDYPVDCAEVTRRWPAVRLSRKPPKGESAEDNQLRKMLEIQQALDESTTQLSQQLGLLQ